MRSFETLLLTLILLLASGLAQAQIYKCKSLDGQTVYQQTPCSDELTGQRVEEWPQPSAADVAAAQARDAAREQESRRRSEQSDHVLVAQGRNPPAPRRSTPTGSHRQELERRLQHRHASLAAIKGTSQFDAGTRARLLSEISELNAQLQPETGQR